MTGSDQHVGSAPHGSTEPGAGDGPGTPHTGTGRLFGVGVGPGDPELMSVKAHRLIQAADVIAYPVASHGRSVARGIAAPFLREEQIEVAMVYPVTTGTTEHPGGYEGAIAQFYDESADELAVHLRAGRDVVVLCEGDPFFYGSYMYLHERLSPHFPTEVVPGVTAFSAAAASSGLPLVKRDDVLVVLPGTLPQDQLEAHLQVADAAVLMKLGRTFPGVAAALEATGMAGRAQYVERASSDRERKMPLREVDPEEVPYMSIVLAPGTDQGCDTPAFAERGSEAAAAVGVPAHEAVVATGAVSGGSVVGDGVFSTSLDDGLREGGWVTVVGLGPAGAQTLTPEAHAALAEATDVIGYDTYIARVPPRRGQRRHGSDNRVELDRARHALELAAAGGRVAVVSSGDPGIFAMASAVLEALDAAPEPLRSVDVRVLPGVSAVQAAAARVGAPVGHDLALISLSDIRKPWSIIERRLVAAAESDLVVALYNPASKTRREQLDRAVAVLRERKDPSTVVIVARAVGDPAGERIDVTTLGALDPAVVDMRTLLIIGSSLTRVIERDGQPPVVYTPRDYPGFE
jgi:precorrin-2 C20-methyltransferase/precorrin-3B C17-methyltransferase